MGEPHGPPPDDPEHPTPPTPDEEDMPEPSQPSLIPEEDEEEVPA
jgi:hypothetical protein